MLEQLEFLVLKRHTIYKHHFTQFNLGDVVTAAIAVTPIISRSGIVYRYTDSDIARLRSEHFDLLIRCGSGLLRGDILNASRFGVISFHHGDNRINRGGPAGFWEVYFRQASTGFIIQQLTEELDGGNVLFRGACPTRYFHLLNQAALCEKSIYYMQALLSRTAISRTLPAANVSLPYSNTLFKRPTLSEQFRYGRRLLFWVAQKQFRKLLGKRLTWSVAFSLGDWRTLVMWRGVKIDNPKNRYLADPFVTNHGGESYCFVEEFNQTTSIGCISVYKLKDRSFERIGTAIAEPFHLSFPYLFEFESELYMCPETSKNRDIRIYECVEFPLQWRLRKIVMSNISAAENMIFERNGLWWLFTNIDTANVGDHSSELFIFCADTPLSEWQSHAKNPIFVDSAKARNGGLLFDGDAVFRVSQKQGFDAYGKGSDLNQIQVLSKTEYSETTVGSIDPNFSKGLEGTHHMHSNGKFTVFDLAKYDFISRHSN